MNTYQITPTYEEKDPVMHVCNDMIGYVVDWRYTKKTQGFEYLVTFGTGICRLWLDENELKPATNESHKPN